MTESTKDADLIIISAPLSSYKEILLSKIKYDTLKIYSDVIGFNLDSVLSKVNCIPKLY